MNELAPGSRIGVFEVIGLLGEGGMGKVYRARDTRLNRDVALKILPDAFAADPDRLARFTREAQTLAALNHPHIAHIYGLEESGTVRALVMELVEGEDLSQRIARGRLPLDEALPIARQIAEALEAAHEQGIIHRDLKPANIKVTPDATVKVLDFGLAKALDPLSSVSADAGNSPTLSMHATQAGIILGTAAYMSPEQARGRPTDKRSDVWSFGCVLFEMLSGTRAFDGEDATEIIAAVVKTPPDWTALPAEVPAQIVTLIKRCLEKDRKLRIGDIAVARFLLSDGPALDTSTNPGAPARSRVAILAAIAVVLAVALAAVAFVHFTERPPAAKVVRFQIPGPADGSFGGPATLLSPDGTLLAFQARGPSGQTQLWVQSLDSHEARPLAGTELTSDPFWSPDSRFLAFFAANRLKKVAVSGGAPQTVCELAGTWYGGAWSPAGVITFGTVGRGMMRVPQTGGTPVPVTTLDTSRSGLYHGGPWFLPDGRHFFYYRDGGGNSEYSGVYLGSLDATAERQSPKPLVTNAYGAVYAPSSSSRTGWMLFIRDGSLLVQPFDPGRLELTGEAIPVAEGFSATQGPRPFSVSMTGMLAYRTGGAGTGRRLTWIDREGKPLGTAGELGEYNTLSLSPDGTRVAVSRAETGRSGTSDIWTHEFARGTSTRLTSDPALDLFAVWSPDGNTMIFSSNRIGNYDLYRKGSNGAGDEEALLKTPQAEYAQDWSRDGRFLLVSISGAPEGLPSGGISLELAVVDLEGGPKQQRYLNTGFNESQGRFSPDGQFVAYTSNSSGKNEIYVQPFPNSERGKWMISRGGGSQPRWRRDGRELFYISSDSKMMAVDVVNAPVFTPGIPKVLFDAPIWGGGQTNNVTRYDVSADGKRFLINAVSPEGRATPISVVLNWEGILKR